MTKYNCGVVVPVYKNKYIKNIIASLRATCEPDALICIVNDGGKEVADYLNRIELPPNFEVTETERNSGFAAANNHGWKYILRKYDEIKYLGSINDDTWPYRGWLERLREALDNHPGAALSMPVMITKKRKGIFARNRAFAVWRLKGSSDMEPLLDDIQADSFTSAVNGFCFLAVRDALISVGMFDESYLNGCEDLDLGIRLLESGYRLVVTPKARVFHYGGGSRLSSGVSARLEFNHRLLEKKCDGNAEQYNRLDAQGHLVKELQGHPAVRKADKKRFAAHVLMFNCDQFILRMIENCGPFVDKIYVAYSDLPWTYNPDARTKYRNTTDKNILKHSKYQAKIELIEGVWDTEEEQRNSCLEKAKADGFDYLLIHDADEYYTQHDYAMNLKHIECNPEWELYATPWCSFWKNLDYVIHDADGSEILGYPEFAINLHKDVKFVRARTTSAKERFILKGLCYHLSFVYSDDEVYKKISTWGHAHQFNRDKWYQNKWIKWNEHVRNLHPIEPAAWKRAVKFKGDLPEALAGFEALPINIYWAGLLDKAGYLVEELTLKLSGRRHA